MTVLLIRLAGPMQSWGVQSRFTIRDTGLEPSRSGVVGLLCAALGRKRSEPLDDFARLQMAVRVDREAELRRDFHTAGGGRLALRPLTVGGRRYGVVKSSGAKDDTVLSHRDYLADADFLVGLAGEPAFLEQLDAALASPRWPLSLGRKSFVPGRPIRMENEADRLHDSDDAESVLRNFPWIKPRKKNLRPGVFRLRMVVETDDPNAADGHPCDVPLSFEPRRFTTRFTKTAWIKPGELEAIARPEKEDPLCI